MGEIKKQGIFNMLITFLGILLGFVNILVIQPFYLAPEEIGLTRILFSFSLIVSTIIPLGITNTTIRFFPYFRNPDKRHSGYFGFMMLFPIAGLLLTGGLLYVFRQYIMDQYSVQSPLFTEFFHYILPFSFILALISVLNIYAYSLFKTVVPSLLNDVFTRIAFILLVGAYFVRWIDLDQFIVLFIFIYGIQLLVLSAYIIFIDKPSFRIIKEDFIEKKHQNILQYTFTFSLASLASLGLKYLDMVMIGKYLALEFAGIYAIAAFIPTVIEAPLNALEKISTTKISDAMAFKRTDEIKTIYYQSSKYLLLIGGLIFLGITINIKKLLMLLPPDYAGAENVVYILSVGTLFNMATGLNSPIIFNSDYYKAGIAMLLALIVLSFLSYIVFIPMFNLEGAAFATVFAALIYNAAKFWYIKQKLNLQPFDRNTIKLLALIATCFIVLMPGFNLDSIILEIVLKSSFITSVYISGVYVLKIAPELFEKENFDSLKKMFGK